MRSDYEWVAGSWQITPQGLFRVESRWLRDANGWYRVPGFWSRRADRAVVETDMTVANRESWRTTGPPSDHPDDNPKPAPGSDFFFVPGHYRPSGDKIVWRPGFSAYSARLGLGARAWVRRGEGWQSERGTWVPDPASAVVTRNGFRRNTGPPPPPVEGSPADVDTPPGEIIGRRNDRLLDPDRDIDPMTFRPL